MYDSITEKDIEKHDFSGKDLTGFDFSNKVLIGADFSNCDCSGCDFSGSDLSFANFKGANLYRADFSKAVLYVTYFIDCDLTRADFNNSYLYGVKFVGNVNTTYCNFSDIKLEVDRRNTAFPKDLLKYQEIQFSDNIMDDSSLMKTQQGISYRNLYGTKFYCGTHYMEFQDYKAYEKEMQLSQVYNRLKRIYKENNFHTEAGEFYYLEKFWQTRSWFSTGTKEDFHFRKSLSRILKTFFSKTNEVVCGYGERPLRVSFWIIIGILLFSIAYYFGSFNEIECCDGSLISQIGNTLYYSICTLTTLGHPNLTPTGFNKTLTAIESLFGITMIALFTATIIRKLIRD